MEYNYNECPECGYFNINKPDTCPSCGFDWATYRMELSLKQADELRRKIEEEILAEKELQYKLAIDLLYSNQHNSAMVAFSALGEYKDSKDFAEKAKHALYDAAVDKFAGNPFLSTFYTANADRKHREISVPAFINMQYTEEDPKLLIQIRKSFEELNGAYESNKYIIACNETINELEKIRQLVKKEEEYNQGVAALNARKYRDAIHIFYKLGDFKDSIELLKKSEVLLSKEEQSVKRNNGFVMVDLSHLFNNNK